MSRGSSFARGVTGAFACALAAGSIVSAASPSARLENRVARQDGAGEASARVYELMAPIDGRASLVLGNRMPIPTQTSTAEGTAEAQSERVTSYSYQDVGFTARVETQLEGEDRLRVSGFIR